MRMWPVVACSLLLITGCNRPSAGADVDAAPLPTAGEESSSTTEPETPTEGRGEPREAEGSTPDFILEMVLDDVGSVAWNEAHWRRGFERRAGVIETPDGFRRHLGRPCRVLRDRNGDGRVDQILLNQVSNTGTVGQSRVLTPEDAVDTPELPLGARLSFPVTVRERVFDMLREGNLDGLERTVVDADGNVVSVEIYDLTRQASTERVGAIFDTHGNKLFEAIVSHNGRIVGRNAMEYGCYGR